MTAFTISQLDAGAFEVQHRRGSALVVSERAGQWVVENAGLKLASFDTWQEAKLYAKLSLIRGR